MNIIGCRFNDEDGSIVIEWYEDSDHKQEGYTIHSTVITSEGAENWKHVGYYAKELYDDALTLIDWFNKYSDGRYADNG